jgi:hypothetical protein
MLAFKKKIVKYINPLKTESSFDFWFKISKELLGLDEDVIFGIVYIPPKYIVYSSIDAFSEIENEYLTLQRNYKYIVLNGDINGRTANETDFIFIEDNLCNIDLPELFYVNRVNILEELNIPVNRTSQDIVKNQYGNRLLELCKCNDLFIVNGRIGGDKNIGKLTCKNSNIVDYVISSV